MKIAFTRTKFARHCLHHPEETCFMVTIYKSKEQGMVSCNVSRYTYAKYCHSKSGWVQNSFDVLG